MSCHYSFPSFFSCNSTQLTHAHLLPSWDGTSGVHTHMTNTRITDAEVFERRYPVILREFSLRRGSAGRGQHRGGEGVVRDIEFRIPVQVSILSERRVFRPYGLEGGEDAGVGRNLWIRRSAEADGADEGRRKAGEDATFREVNLGGKNTAAMRPGERIVIMTPGGGGWGKVGQESVARRERDHMHAWRKGSVAARMETAESSV